MEKLIMRDGNQEEMDYVLEKLVEYNLSQVPKTQNESYVYINKIIENENNEIIAGIYAKMYCWNCIYIDMLWVNVNYRKDGLGSKLLLEVEEIARIEKCNLIHLDTFDFQAKDFYLKHGYEVFGVLDDCPINHKRYFLKKLLK